jgi:hypothetical protein
MRCSALKRRLDPRRYLFGLIATAAIERPSRLDRRTGSLIRPTPFTDPV